MAWIEFHTALRDHWKIQRLADRLEIPYTQALGCIGCLWLWLPDNAPDGNVTRFTDKELCRAARIDHEKNIKGILRDCELLDDKDRIHDWSKHGIKYLQSMRLRVKKHRLRKRIGNVTVQDGNVTVTPTLPNLTLPYLKEEKDFKDVSGETAKSPPSSPPSPPEIPFVPVLTFPTDGKEKSWDLSPDQVEEWREAFPTLNVLQECRSALAWLKAKPDRRKTTRGMPTFLVNWLNRSQNHGRPSVAPQAAPPKNWGAATPVPGKYAGIAKVVEN